MKLHAMIREGEIRLPQFTTPQVAWLLKRNGQGVEVEIRDQAAIRSNRQNRYWWGCIVKTVAEQWEREGILWQEVPGVPTPLPTDVVHDALVTAFGDGFVDTPFGRARRSTTSYSVKEFTRLIDRVAEWYLEKYKGHLPKPEEWSEE